MTQTDEFPVKSGQPLKLRPKIMKTSTRTFFNWLGFNAELAQDIPTSATASQVRLFRCLRILFGFVWLFNSWTASSVATKQIVAHIVGLPLSSLAVHILGDGVVMLDLYIALALLFGIGMRSAMWIGLGYSLVLWILVWHVGDFNPSTGGTDPGVAPLYMITLILAYNCWLITQPASSTPGHDAHLWIYVARLAFGFVWAYDALFKWHPYFFTHFVSYFTAGQQGEPAWLASYSQIYIDIITAISPVLIAVLAALLEVIIAWSLLSGKWKRIFFPIGLIYSFAIWTTAEGFGGPYTSAGQTGLPGNVFGISAMYAVVFAYLMAAYRWPCGRRH